MSRYVPPADPLTPVAPRYAGDGLVDVLPSALAVLGVPGAVDRLGLAPRLAGVRRIAVLLVDGLGWYQIPVAAPHAPTLAGLAATAGRPIVTGFPSTTPTSLVTLGTGVAPGEHGVLGFRVRVPGSDRVLSHIEWGDDPDPARWQPVPTQLQRARAAGVTTTVVSRPEHGGSGLTLAANRGGDFRGAADLDALAVELLTALAAGTGPTLVSGYHPDVDRWGHVTGVDSPHWRVAVAELDALLARLVDGLPADAALLVTADHGQLNIPVEHRFDVDADPLLRAGVRLVTGEPRVRYLHVEPGAEHDVLAAWSATLGAAARVLTRDEAVATGWFGPVAPEHLARLGDVVVICRDTHAVVATRSEPPMASRLVGYHGADTAVEMTVPLLVVRG
ncbi:alkaline phosphatase family protein [Micromonospora yangpuensis]|uniref:Type I phosphodiesterase / nucleotide pyrophosphatase n=1 Tax=Micromonospora yangpuensis TaxID=683228 RepID=A0A1C6V000_9ACTN|nr:nucleotide pyrophosphatase/phosphodiesterase family protein [Micromonospora yangpuensis]GGL96577.1 alkaline phosphatase family protein [Micromonospora yangpuensis]SCL59616.1 Type I phosphodiesterase / nucleotide pyrophosphatase [Micromonospora yangpuensis]